MRGEPFIPIAMSGGCQVDSDILVALQADPVVWANYQKQPELYRRVRIDAVQFNKKIRPELYRTRLQKYIENTRKGILYGEWNDGGRLTDNI